MLLPQVDIAAAWRLRHCPQNVVTELDKLVVDVAMSKSVLMNSLVRQPSIDAHPEVAKLMMIHYSAEVHQLKLVISRQMKLSLGSMSACRSLT